MVEHRQPGVHGGLALLVLDLREQMLQLYCNDWNLIALQAKPAFGDIPLPECSCTQLWGAAGTPSAGFPRSPAMQDEPAHHHMLDTHALM